MKAQRKFSVKAGRPARVKKRRPPAFPPRPG